MKLTTLGGSAAGVGTQQGCSSYLVESDTASIVLDMGPGTLLELRAHIDYRSIDGIVISHLHADHILDLVALRFTLSYNPVSAPARIPLFVPPDGIDTLERIALAFEGPGSGLEWFSVVFDIHQYDPDAEVMLGDLVCTFHPTVHYVPCWAIRVRSDDGDLLYTADTGPTADLTTFGQGASVVVAEATDRPDNPAPIQERGHLTPEEAAQLAVDIGANTLVLTHIWEEYDPGEVMDNAGSVFAGALLRASPGMTVRWSS